MINTQYLSILFSVAVLFSNLAYAGISQRFSWDMNVPLTDRAQYIDWMVKNRGETPKYLGQRWDRVQAMIAHKDLWDANVKRAVLLAPRDEFVQKYNRFASYESKFLDIGYGVTISGPHLVGRMTNTLDIKPGDKVLEIGTGSGYQSAVLSLLTDQVYSIEIIRPLAARTRTVYDDLIKQGYDEYKHITTKNDDGYYGWPEKGPFDKIIVTCGIDHVPPPLLQQLKPNGMMLIPVGPPGAQHVLKVTKSQGPDGKMLVSRSDIYNGRIVPFVPFTGTHNN